MRAINVPGHAVVTMSDVRDAFAAAGCAKVRTCIQSGNVIFEPRARDTAGILQKVRGTLRTVLGEEPDIFLRTVHELEFIEQELGVTATSRNWSTITKIVELVRRA